MSEPLRGGARVRLVSYNLRDLLDDRDAAAHVLRSLRCDVACLQEVPRRWFQRGRVSRLARECGLRWVSGGRTSGGTAVLVGRRPDLVAAGAFRLPVRGPFTRSRGAATATVAVDGCRLTAVSVHLPLSSQLRVSHARLVRARVGAAPPAGTAPSALVIAGDLNEPPDGPAWRVLSAGLRDAGAGPDAAATYPAHRPSRRIDAVLVSDSVEVTQVRVPGWPDGLVLDGPDPLLPDDLRAASDHLPVVADLVLPPV